ncbi:MAG: ATP-binding protein, partial [Myxococcota bacterium]
MTINEDCQRSFNGDPLCIKQALVNLLGNAVKFTDEGYVSLHVSTRGGGSDVRFAVRDTGPGIDPKQQAVIFERFSQADTEATSLLAGTGLGLAITAAIAKKMGGEVGVESTLGQGALFWFQVPLETAPNPLACDQLSLSPTVSLTPYTKDT